MFADILEFLLLQVVKSSQKENAFQIMKYAQMEENIALHKNLYPISQISNMERSIKNTKNELFLMQKFCSIILLQTMVIEITLLLVPIPLQFFAMTVD